MTNALSVANYFLSKGANGGKRDTQVSPLKLQKLLYYAQAWNSAIKGDSMFNEEIEAWVHGPVVSDVYKHFRDYGYQPINEFNPKEIKKIKSEHRELLDAVWNAYGHYDAKELEEMTHQEPPWKEAREGLSPTQNSNNKIEIDSMIRYFRGFASS
ncbi:putative phage-associated protein [Sinobaca qinghaiensis]|uniref:Putative phage-associated protein n=1 Tax=Sinobaca qinghaiensis TaxID=342944 RepID=A0A419V545_9BACL|nr:type II toxin-antitoxin system antitoxin SocA domain-containing protein [Sinobaca qinghaiensis]RKD73647.1 putative phage-associated protein [Sinobaca qinghaiensis]